MRAKKLAHEMSVHELEARLVRFTGVRKPSDGAPREDWDGWFVAVWFTLGAHIFAPGEAEAWAATDILRGSDFARYRPFVEQALGRPITEAEIAAARTDDFEKHRPSIEQALAEMAAKEATAAQVLA